MRVAFDARGVPPSTCNKVFVWNVQTRMIKRVSGPNTCSADISPAGGVEVAVAGRQIAWIVSGASLGQSHESLRTASLPRPSERRLAAASGAGLDTDGNPGDWIGHLVGSGSLIVVNRWTTDAAGAVTRSELDVVGTKSLRRIVSGPDALFASSVDSGRIAVLRTDGSVGIYNGSGRLLREVRPSSAKEVALQGDSLVVLTKTGTLEIYNSRSGAYVRSWPVSVWAAGVDVYGGVAVYVEVGQAFPVDPDKDHVLRLKSGKDRVLVINAFRIEIGSAGVVYEKPFGKHGTPLVFVPMRRVLANAH
ncbi:MAG: hypothetical protein WB462_11820, partial [Solirubrobacterales bacterium]